MKKTKREYFKEILAIEGISDEIKTFVNAEIDLLYKKNSYRKPSKEQEANVAYKAQIVEILANAGTPLTASEIHKSMSYAGDNQVQKTSALLAQLVNRGEVVKDTDKRKSVFSLAEVESDEDSTEVSAE